MSYDCYVEICYVGLLCRNIVSKTHSELSIIFFLWIGKELEIYTFPTYIFYLETKTSNNWHIIFLITLKIDKLDIILDCYYGTIFGTFDTHNNYKRNPTSIMYFLRVWWWVVWQWKTRKEGGGGWRRGRGKLQGGGGRLGREKSGEVGRTRRRRRKWRSLGGEGRLPPGGLSEEREIGDTYLLLYGNSFGVKITVCMNWTSMRKVILCFSFDCFSVR